MADNPQVRINLESPTVLKVSSSSASARVLLEEQLRAVVNVAERGERGDTGATGPQGPAGQNGTTYTLPTANATTLGGVKVGSNLSISNGVLSAVGGTTTLPWGNITSTPTSLSGYGITDGLTAANLAPYLTVANAAATYSVLGHTHGISSITGLQSALDLKLNAANLTFANLTGKPSTLSGYGITDGLTASDLSPYLTIATAASTYSVLGHTHSIANVTGLQTALDSKLPSANFTYANISGTPNLTAYVLKTQSSTQTIASTASFGSDSTTLSLNSSSYSMTVNTLAGTSILSVTPTTATLVLAGGGSWTANSILTQGYADTRYALAASVSSDWANITNKPTITNTFNGRSGDVVLTENDVTSLVSNVYQPVIANTTYGLTVTPMLSGANNITYTGESVDLGTNKYFTGLRKSMRANGTFLTTGISYQSGAYSIDANGTAASVSCLSYIPTIISLTSSCLSNTSYGSGISIGSSGSLSVSSRSGDSANSTAIALGSGQITGTVYSSGFKLTGGTGLANTGDFIFKLGASGVNDYDNGIRLSKVAQDASIAMPYANNFNGIDYTYEAGIRTKDGVPSTKNIALYYSYSSANTTSTTALTLSSNNTELAYAVTPVLTANSVLTQGYADTRYAPISVTSYSLPTATDSVLGGIKVGANLTIANGVLSALSSGGGSGIYDGGTAFSSDNTFDGGSATG